MKRKLPLAAVPVLFGLGLAPALPSTDALAANTLPYADEIDSCVATVNAHIDLENAKRVRHIVSDARQMANGYALTIETSVFFRDPAAGREKRFEAYCVVRGGHEPSTFRIATIDA